MRIEGKATITLTDIRTGEKKIYTHKNDLTEFATEYFRECGALNQYPLGSLSSQYPLDDLFGGIMCFRAPILNNSAQFPTRKPLYMPAGNAMIANASIDNQSNSPEGATELGQYNQTESSSSTDQRTYFYDWDTNEGVGEISAICLTTRAGGYIGAGNARSGKSEVTLLNRSWEAYSGTPAPDRTIDSDTQSRLCGLDIGNAQVGTIATTAAQALQSGTVTINWYDAPISKLNPFENISTFKDYTMVGTVKTLNTPRRSETHTFTAAPTASYARVMGGTGYVLIVGANGTAIQNGATVYARQIQKDGTVVPFSATIAGMSGSIPLNAASTTYFIGGEIINGALYLKGAATNGSANAVTIKIASDGAVTNLADANATDTERVFFNQEGRIYLGGVQRQDNLPKMGVRYYDTATGEIIKTNGNRWSDNAWQAGIWATYDSPCLFVTQGTTAVGIKVSPLSILRPPCNWLSTINNLEDTITKTGTQTMKIRYTLTLYRAPDNP